MRSSHVRLGTPIIVALFVAAACTSAASPIPVMPSTPTATPPAAATPSPASPSAPSPSQLVMSVELIGFGGGTLSTIEVVDESGTLVGARTGQPAQDPSEPSPKVANDPADPTTLVLTWFGILDDTDRRLTIAPDGRTMTLDVLPGCGDLVPVNRVLALAFSVPVPADEVTVTIVAEPRTCEDTERATGTVAVTVVDSLRVRSEPRISEDSYKEKPLLPLGTTLYVLDGPVSASGYDWYQVFPLASRTLPQGWVASASRDGEPWIADGDFACPAMPIDIRSLAALRPGVGLACFPRVPIEVKARLIRLGGELDGGAYTPGWFGVGQLGGMLLVEPEVTRPPADPRKWFILMLDPAGRHPDVLPVGEVVKVTGVFDHPAAAACTFDSGREPVPSQDCRLMFAVKRLVVIRP